MVFYFIFGFIALWFLYELFDNMLGYYSEIVDAVVVGSNFSPSNIGVGPSVINGQMGVSSYYTPENWTVIVKIAGSKIEAIGVSKDTWAKFKVGDQLKVQVYRGKFSGKIKLYKIIN